MSADRSFRRLEAGGQLVGEPENEAWSPLDSVPGRSGRPEMLRIATLVFKRLAEAAQRRHLTSTMDSQLGYRIRAVLLTLLLALGMSLSFVQGGLMSAEMAVSTEAGHAGPGGCDGCSGGEDGQTDAGMCLSVCGSAAHGMPPGEPPAQPAASRASFQAVHSLLGGRSHSPDHGPPRILTLG